MGISAEIVLVVGNGSLNDLLSLLPALHVTGHGLLALQSFIDREEMAHLIEKMTGQLGDILGGVRFPESGASRWLVQPPKPGEVVSNTGSIS